jgi:vacuolar-type H+-ATPase subunit H
MATRAGPPGPLSPPPTGGDLARLLDTEARLEQVLQHARDEATRLVAEAREAARACEAALGAELEAAAQRLAAEIAGERDRAAVEITAAARRDTERLAAVTGERIRDLARRVVERVIGGTP